MLVYLREVFMFWMVFRAGVSCLTLGVILLLYIIYYTYTYTYYYILYYYILYYSYYYILFYLILYSSLLLLFLSSLTPLTLLFFCSFSSFPPSPSNLSPLPFLILIFSSILIQILPHPIILFHTSNPGVLVDG